MSPNVPAVREGASSFPPATVARYAASILLLLGTPALAAANGSEPYLVVRGADHAVLARVPLAHAPEWHIEWRHSVSGVRVRDFYAYRNGTMLLTRSHTPAFDAGLGHLPGRGRAESDGAGGYWILDLDEPVPGNAYALRVGGPAVGHTLVHASGRMNLSELAAGTRVRIGIEFE